MRGHLAALAAAALLAAGCQPAPVNARPIAEPLPRPTAPIEVPAATAELATCSERCYTVCYTETDVPACMLVSVYAGMLYLEEHETTVVPDDRGLVRLPHGGLIRLPPELRASFASP